MRILLEIRRLERRIWSLPAGHVLVGFLLLFLLIQFIQRGINSTPGKMEIDIAAYTAAAHALSDGNPIYPRGAWPLTQENPLAGFELAEGIESRDNQYYLYPPFLAWLLGFVLWLPYPVLETCWNALSILAYAGGTALWLMPHWKNRTLLSSECVFFLIIAVYWAPFALATVVGQITPLLYLVLILHITQAKQNHDIISGIALAIAILLKVSPGLLFVYWLVQKRWILISATMLTVLFATLLSGWALSLEFVGAILPHLSLGENSPLNHSFTGALIRLSYGEPWGWITAEGYRQHATSHAFIRWGSFLGFAASLITALRCRSVETAVSVLLLGHMVWAPVTRLHDMVIVVWILFVLFCELRNRGGIAGWVLWCYALLTLNVNTISFHEPFIIDPLSRELFSHPPTLALLLLWLYPLFRFWSFPPGKTVPHIS